MAPLQVRFLPLAVYLALTLVAVTVFLVLARGDLSVIREYWGLLAIALGVPWSIVPLLLNQFANVPAGLLTGMIAVSVPLNAALLYRVGRRLERARSARAG